MDQDTETGTPPWPLATIAGEPNGPLQVNLQFTAFRNKRPIDVLGGDHLVERAPVFHEPENGTCSATESLSQGSKRPIPQALSR